MAKSFRLSTFNEFMRQNGALDHISRDDFDSDEEYDQCLHELSEGSKVILMENGGDLEKSMQYLSEVEDRIGTAVRNPRRSFE